MYTDDGQIDGSWNLHVHVIDVKKDIVLRVTGEKSIGSVMFMLVEKINTKMNWSDHGLWWPSRRRWLLQTRSTLDQSGVQSDSRLMFVRMHNMIKVRLPDLQVREMRVNFAKKVFGVVVQMCHDLGIRHPEELSLSRPYSAEDLKLERIPIPDQLEIQSCNGGVPWNTPTSPRFHPNGSASPSPLLQSQSSRISNGPVFVPNTPNTPSSPQFLTVSHSPLTLNRGGHLANGSSSHTLMPASVNSLRFEGVEESLLANSPYIGTEEALTGRRLVRLKTLIQRSRIHGAWLNSSQSLMEQGIVPNEASMVCLRFKFYNFYDLNPKYDAVRVNQLYEQGKWSLISEETECNEEEMIVFAALQLQVHLQTNAELEGGSPSRNSSSPTSPKSLDRRSGGDVTDGRMMAPSIEEEEEDEVDAALAELQMQLEGGDAMKSPNPNPSSPLRSPGMKNSSDNRLISNNEVLDVPQISDYLKFFKPRKFTLKGYKRMWVILRETTLYMYRYHQDVNGPALETFHLQRCEIQSDVNVTTKKYGIRLFIAGGENMTEIWLRCESKDQFAQWMAACRLASSGKTLASRALFDSEKESTLNFLEMQSPSPQPVLTTDSMPKIDPLDYVSRSVLKKVKSKQLLQRIAEAHSKVRTMSSVEAKLQFIRNWKQLSNYGFTRFIVRFQNSKKDEIFGVTDTRLIRMDASAGDLIKSWRLKDIQAWNVNWNTENVILNFNDEKVVFHPLSADCKTVHEFVGGYVFMHMRSPEKSQELNEAYFHKLTGGNPST